MPHNTIASWTLGLAGKRYTAGPEFDIASVLLEAGDLPHPYVGDQEIEVQHIGDMAFSAEAGFDGPLLRGEGWRTRLTLPRVDTVARVSVNGVELGRTENAFRPWSFDLEEIGSALKQGKNSLRIDFESPVQAGKARQDAAKYLYPYSKFPIQSQYRNMLRKPQCHSGWDWGPSLATSGIYEPVRIETDRWIRLGETQVRVVPPSKKAEAWRVLLRVDYECWKEGGLKLGGNLELVGPAEKAGSQRKITQNIVQELPEGNGSFDVELSVEEPELWWPNGMGPQALYQLAMRLEGEVPFERAWQLGFRKLELVTEEDEYGKSFFFRVNGRAFFAKGANWIPTDALPASQDPRRTRSLLEGARDAHMNMIRVWGGGQYETEDFYGLCDRLGILVWQDFMFSCGTYPADRAYLAEVEQEVRHQVARLGHRPSLAIWCGNNETLGSLTWYPESRASRDRYLVDYDRLYEGTVGRVVRELDPERVFWPSSPSGGSDEYGDGWHDDSRGDMHYWSVWHEGKPFNAYFSVIPRFCSEFGFQSFPTPEGISRAMPDVFAGTAGLAEFPKGISGGPVPAASLSARAKTGEGGRPDATTEPKTDAKTNAGAWSGADEWNLTGPTVDHHQKSPRGNTIILETMARYYRMPSDPAGIFYVSQIQQNRAFETAVDFWRSQAPRSMGALYWQLNDLWPVASWSSIEYPDKWKLTHYGARRFFEPVRIALLHRNPESAIGEVPSRHSPIEAVILNDTGRPLRLGMRLRLWSFDGQSRMLDERVLDVSGDFVTRLRTVDPDELGIDGRDWFLHGEIRWQGDEDGPGGGQAWKQGDVLSCGSRFFCAPKQARLADPGLSLKPQSGTELGIEISVKRPAFNVFLDSPGLLGRWSENNETVLPGEAWTPKFLVRDPADWTSALVAPRDLALRAEAERHGPAAIFADYTQVYDLWSAGH